MAEEAAAAGGMPVKRDLFRTEHTLLSASLREGLSALYDLFDQAPELGSLIDPRSVKADLFQADFASLQPVLAAVLERERASDERTERAAAAHGMALAAELLAGQYTLVITNVPYLARGKQSPSLRNWIDQRFPDARTDLATVFLLRLQRSLHPGGTTALVTPQNWLFLPSYQTLRRRLLSECQWDVITQLGANAFRGMNFWAATTALTVVSRSRPHECHCMTMFDVSIEKAQDAKAETLADRRSCDVTIVRQSLQITNPDSRITMKPGSAQTLLSSYARSPQGIKTGDDARYRRHVWEVGSDEHRWRPLQGASLQAKWINGLDTVIDWVDEGASFARLQGQTGWGQAGVVLKLMGEVRTSFYTGAVFDSNVTVVVPKESDLLPAIAMFCASSEYGELLRRAEPAAKINNATAVKVPFDAELWRNRARKRWPAGLGEPSSDDPTQYLFHGHPAWTEPHAVLQVAVARLLGYRWPPEHDREMRLAEDARARVEACRQLDAFTDDDGIVCLASLRGEAGAADRISRLLAFAFGGAWSVAKERELLAAASVDGTRSDSLEQWLHDRFFQEHCKLFQQRPFIWHVWDGRKDGFHALVNYHRLVGPDGEARRTLEALAYSYLGDWIDRQKAEQREEKEGSDARLASAQELQAQLDRIISGEPPCDLFVRWKPLFRQPIGWDPDINDGVRLNIRPFLSAELRTGGRKGAGILRWKPGVNWKKDRGQEPRDPRPREDFPWFWSCPGDGSSEERTAFMGGVEFDGNRWNDLHYTNAAKRAARDRERSSAMGSGGPPPSGRRSLHRVESEETESQDIHPANGAAHGRYRP